MIIKNNLHELDVSELRNTAVDRSLTDMATESSVTPALPMLPFPPQLECQACGHIWLRRANRLPRTCPRCKSYRWQKTEWEVEHNVRPRRKTRQSM